MLCLLRCGQYALRSRIKQGSYFWLAAILVFLAVIRRELNHLPDLFVPDNFSLLSQNYDWWEDGILLIVYLLIVGFLIYSWRYCWTLLKRVPISLYLSVALLAVLQYLGENHILFSKPVGLILEELTEAVIYSIALVYLWQLKLPYFEATLANKFDFSWQSSNRQSSKL